MPDRKAKILIVDDTDSVRRLLETLLQADGFSTLSAENGERALQLAESELPDLILLDLMMPGMDGFAVAKKLKSTPDTMAIPIIIVSALEDRESRMRGLEAGAEEYLTKPIDRMDLRIRVRNLLRLKEFSDFLRNHNRLLESQVQERTKELHNSFVETIYTLVRASEYQTTRPAPMSSVSVTTPGCWRKRWAWMPISAKPSFMPAPCMISAKSAFRIISCSSRAALQRMSGRS